MSLAFCIEQYKDPFVGAYVCRLRLVSSLVSRLDRMKLGRLDYRVVELLDQFTRTGRASSYEVVLRMNW